MYFEYVKLLSHEEQPNYQYLKNLFEEVLTDLKVKDSEKEFDWIPIFRKL